MKRMPAPFFQVQNKVRLSMAEKRLNSGEIREIPVSSTVDDVKTFNPISYNLFVIYYAIEFGPYKKLCDNIEMSLCHRWSPDDWSLFYRVVTY